MGIVIKQSIKNTIITFIGFGIGAINVMYMYPVFLGKEYLGLTNYILSAANILYPILSFGIQNTLIKFFILSKSSTPHNSLIECIDNIGIPKSTEVIGRYLDEAGPIVEPPTKSDLLTKY